MFRFVAIISTFIIILISCSKTSDIENSYNSLIGSEICIPFNDFELVSYGAKCDSTFKNWTYVSYVGFNECTPCNMSNVNQWNRIQEIFDKHSLNLKIVLIFSPSKYIKDGIIKNYRQSNCTREIYIDTIGSFMKKNVQVPENSIFHTMLLDSLNRVVLIGNLTRTYKVRELLCSYVDSISKCEK